jgi:hypothetical protein
MHTIGASLLRTSHTRCAGPARRTARRTYMHTLGSAAPPSAQLGASSSSSSEPLSLPPSSSTVSSALRRAADCAAAGAASALRFLPRPLCTASLGARRAAGVGPCTDHSTAQAPRPALVRRAAVSAGGRGRAPDGLARGGAVGLQPDRGLCGRLAPPRRPRGRLLQRLVRALRPQTFVCLQKETHGGRLKPEHVMHVKAAVAAQRCCRGARAAGAARCRPGRPPPAGPRLVVGEAAGGHHDALQRRVVAVRLRGGHLGQHRLAAVHAPHHLRTRARPRGAPPAAAGAGTRAQTARK